jgi:predicted GNAT family N-acyltransferase
VTAVRVRGADWQHDVDKIRRIRTAVFVVEQAVPPALEWDGLDELCTHVLAEDQKRDAVGTGRLHPSGKIGRMAVLPQWRGQGVGAAILRYLVDDARDRGYKEVYLHGQTRVLGFYARFGFVPEGAEFDEAGIPHRLMRLTLTED